LTHSSRTKRGESKSTWFLCRVYTVLGEGRFRKKGRGKGRKLAKGLGKMRGQRGGEGHGIADGE